VLVASLVPLALHYVRFARGRNAKIFFGVAIVVLLSAMPTTVARSGVVAAAVGVGVYAVEWSNRGRLNALVLAIIGGGIFRAAFPGLLGTIKSLFLAGTKDPSISSRTDTYAQIPSLLEHHWLLGRGLGTFQPAQYFFLDNQYLGTLLEEGVVGLVAMLAIFVGGMCLARGARKWSLDPETRSLGQAIAASLAALTATAATFDEFGFRQTFFVVCLLVGCAGALWKMRHADPHQFTVASGMSAVSRGTARA
jgi:O-antigen ligase